MVWVSLEGGKTEQGIEQVIRGTDYQTFEVSHAER